MFLKKIQKHITLTAPKEGKRLGRDTSFNFYTMDRLINSKIKVTLK